MSGVRVLVGTKKGAFILTSDGLRQKWDVSGPLFAGWEMYHLKGSSADPNRLYASQSSGWFGQVVQRSDDGGKTWQAPGGGVTTGPGGMPTGVSGKVACLLSGGIDSPVAAYRMLQRGCKAIFVHFHGRPFVTRASEEKVREIAEVLTRYQLYSRLYLVPFGDIQRQIVLGAPSAFRIVLYRRMMIRIAEELARREKCWALVTGDSLGQVASQTPENLSVVEEAAQLPILRPLIGMDKLEITEQAQRIGTFETSIEPDQDCCKLFVPAHPSTRTALDPIRKVERSLEIDALVKQGLDKTQLAEFLFP